MYKFVEISPPPPFLLLFICFGKKRNLEIFLKPEFSANLTTNNLLP